MKNNFFIIIGLFLFISITFYSAWKDISSYINKYTNTNLVENKIKDITSLNKIVAQLQKERGLSEIYYAGLKEEQHNILLKQRLETTKIINIISDTLDTSKIRKDRLDIHNNVDSHEYSNDESFKHYTLLIEYLINKSAILVFDTDNSKIKNELILYHHLSEIQENMGQLRAKIGSTLVLKDISDKSYQDIIIIDALLYKNMNSIEINQNAFIYPLLNTIIKESCVKTTFSVTHNIIEKSLASISLSPMEWFKTSTCAIDIVNKNLNTYLDYINIKVLKFKEDAKFHLMKNLIFWFGILLIYIILFSIYFKRSKALARGEQLLQEYKKAIDCSTIVSKTDKGGVITYVNDAFCKISGYTENELLKRPHNIVRHPDVPKIFFKKLWQDLKNAKSWNGVVKNLRKDGTPYWVEATISPIYDDDGSLVEYIAIRHDITDIILLNQDVQDTQRELIYRMGEAVESRSKECGNHIRRVAYYSKLLAQLAGLSDEDSEVIFAASTMHDIGKIAIPDSILLKPGSLNSQEWSSMKTHAEIGYNILQGSNQPLLKVSSIIAYEHHEHYDGNGYPRGIKGNDISVYGRIVSIVDVFDALANERSYKEAWELDRILELLKKESGKQFDPNLIKLFLDNLNQFLDIKNRYDYK